MSIENVLASVAVNDIGRAAAWYARLFGRDGESPVPTVVEWRTPGGGCLQVYELAERAGHGSFTSIVDDLDAQVAALDALGVDTGHRTSNPRVKTVMITDPDGNHIAFAQPIDPSLAR